VVHTFTYPEWDVVFPTTPDEALLPKLAEIVEDIVVYGHSHFRDDRRVGRWHLLNPGSVGFPFDGIKMASYMILDEAPRLAGHLSARAIRLRAHLRGV